MTRVVKLRRSRLADIRRTAEPDPEDEQLQELRQLLYDIDYECGGVRLGVNHALEGIANGDKLAVADGLAMLGDELYVLASISERIGENLEAELRADGDGRPAEDGR